MCLGTDAPPWLVGVGWGGQRWLLRGEGIGSVAWGGCGAEWQAGLVPRAFSKTDPAALGRSACVRSAGAGSCQSLERADCVLRAFLKPGRSIQFCKETESEGTGTR